MLGPAGRLMGDLTVARLAGDVFWLTGSYYLQEWHRRWFQEQLPPTGVELRNLTDDRMGFSVSGPRSRDLLARLTREDVSNEAFPFLAVRQLDVGSWRAVVGRISLTGELGYEIVVPTVGHRTLWHELREAGEDLGLRPIGDRAVDSLRLEKGYGIWAAEFRQDRTPAMCGLDRYVAVDKDGFIGCEAARRERDTAPAWRLALLEIEAIDADARRDDGVWVGERRVGEVTSGAFGHHVGKSLALAHLERDVVEAAPTLTVYVVGEPRPARLLPAAPYDPRGERLRA
jgi:dimethylglycine dehydrogenase